VNALQPLWAAMFAIVLLKSERLGGRRITGLLLGFAGVCALMGQDMLNSDRAGAGAIVLMAGATACYAMSGVLISRWLRHVPPFPLAFAQIGFSALCLLPIALVSRAYSQAEFSPGAVASLLILGGGGSGLAIVGFMWLIQQVGPVRAAVVTYLLPPVGVTLGWLVLGEPVGRNLILGLAFIISGVALVQRTPVAALLRRLAARPAREPVIEPAD
jgi:drug/metabolite transporter (DMT)-like permease